ncbi:MAG: flagellin [Phycisphaeraceae bacterium]|nr:flagellin [Phycisphaeraceae bacterium]
MLNTAVNAWQSHTRHVERSMERIATGKRINRASDDPAGSMAVDQFNADLASLNKKLEANRFDQKYGAARDGGNAAIGDLLLELRGHIVTAANQGALGDTEKRAIQDRVNSIVDAIDFVSNTYTFNGQRVFANALASSLGATLQAEYQKDQSDPTKTKLVEKTLNLVSLKSGGALNLVDGDLEKAQQVIDGAIGQNSADRAAIGAKTKELESQERLLQQQIEGVSGAKSQIEDTDYASEVSNLVKNQVLQQAAAFVMQTAMQQMKQLTTLIGGHPNIR